MDDKSMPVAEAETPAAKRWPKYAIWIGPLLTFVGAVSYFLFFARFPALRDFPLINLPLVLLGVVLAGAGCWQMFRGCGGWFGKAFSSVSFLFSVGIAGLFCFYVFALSYQMPVAVAAPELQAAAPEFALLDQNEQQVKLSDFRGSKVLLVFYRGHW